MMTPTTDKNGTQERLLKSALTLFSNKGYDGTSIREIIEDAGVTRPVLYYYFESKRHLFHHLVVTLFEQFLEDTDRVLSGKTTLRDRLMGLMKDAFEGVANEPEAVRFLLQVFFAPPKDAPFEQEASLWGQRLGRVVQIMRDALESGELRGGNAETLALLFCASMDYHIMLKSHEPRVNLTDDLAEVVVDLFLRGACGGESGAGHGDVTPFGYTPNPLTMPNPLDGSPGRATNLESA